jgi:GT2 family glycosyltransferase
MMTSIVKCHLLDEELVKMTMEALDTIYPYSDETIAITTEDSVLPDYFTNYLLDCDIQLLTANKGFPSFVDTGMSFAKGKYVAVLNNDILLPPNWSKPLLGLFEYNTLLVHPKMLGWNDPILTGREVKENIDPKQGMFFSAFILNKKLYNKVGWDMDYDYSGYDDWDFYYRARKLGYDCIWTDIVQYKHKGGATMDKIGRDQYYKKNRELFITKHGTKPEEIDWYAL